MLKLTNNLSNIKACRRHFLRLPLILTLLLLVQGCSSLIKETTGKETASTNPPVTSSKNSAPVVESSNITVLTIPTAKQNQQSNQLANTPELSKPALATQDNTLIVSPQPETKVYDDLWVKTVDHYGLQHHLNNHHERVLPYIKQYKNQLPYMGRAFERAELFYYFVLNRVIDEGLPAEIALLPIIESHYNTFGYSHSKAAGAWQFIPSTGSMFGLKRTWWYDGRRDIVASTNAAINYLKQLNNTFDGDWLITLAAYNAGPGTLQRAIKKNKQRGLGTDYWSLNLPKETMHYVPKFLGLADVIANKAGTDDLVAIANRPYFEIIDIESQLDLTVAAEMADIEIEHIYQLNSGFNQQATDPKGPHYLIIPVDKSPAFRQALANKPAEERVIWDRYAIKPGDSLLSIAKKYHLNVNAIKSINGLTSNTIYAGKHLLIPIASEQAVAFIMSSSEIAKRLRALPNTPDRTLIHKVKSGENLSVIAEKYQVRVNDILQWNKISANTLLQIGQKLTISR